MLVTILALLAILFVLVVVHEFGHFITAKRFGIRVDEFAFGFPPKLLSIQWGETRYAFNAILIGGYVKIYGENGDDAEEPGGDRRRSFTAQPRWKQALVIAAGPLFNIVLAWVLLSGLFMAGMPTSELSTERPLWDAAVTIVDVRAGTPASGAGFAIGDRVLDVSDGVTEMTPATVQDLISFIKTREGKVLAFGIERDGVREDRIVTPVAGIVEDGAAIGVSLDRIGMLMLPPHLAFVEGGKSTVMLVELTYQEFGKLFSRAVQGEADLDEVSGPVGIAKVAGDAAREGMHEFIFLAALLSINLGIINLMPFPALDGGRILFVGIEAIRRKPLAPAVSNMANVAGFAILLLLIAIVTFNDIAKLV
ncbi:MAG TPA: RIP metalloprotease RseP [Candidatus Paceibacterota bacterium]|nr:RIP metalloprotease RseP [Candidatus Paceibacterota bacterium]